MHAVATQREEAEELAEALRSAQATPKGQKKDTTAAMPRGYHPPAVEAAWCATLQLWLSALECGAHAIAPAVSSPEPGQLCG